MRRSDGFPLSTGRQNMDKNKSIKIGHYTVRHQINKDCESSDFLAFDTGQDRQVQIKAFRIGSDHIESILPQTQALSELRHPNILSFYEIGEQKGVPYLVSEYYDGETLADLIKSKKSFSVSDAVKMMSQILDGISYAHNQGIIHNDLRPENILIGDDGGVRIRGFGISIMINRLKGSDNRQKEITRYTAPECFLKGEAYKSSDVYSLGMILYEMLTFRPCMAASKREDMMYKIAYVPTVHPSLENPDVDPLLDSIVEKATQKDPGARFRNATVMKKAIDYYLGSPEKEELPEPEKSDNQGILNLLLSRMENNSDFPAFSKSITAINEKTSKDQYASARDLADIIMKDYSLTNKMLTLVNSSFYGGLGSGVTSIEQAVIILGLEQVRLMAGAMMVFTQIQDKSNIDELKDSMIKSYMSGLIAIEVAKQVKSKDAEVVFLCAMFQTLGRNLTIYYMPDEYSNIRVLMNEKGIDISAASHEVLGASLDEIGVCVARYWKFPEAIIYGMRSLPEGVVNKPESKLEMIRHFSIFANEICDVAGHGFDDQSINKLIQLMKKFEPGISISEKDVFRILFDSIEKIKNHASVLGINAEKSRFITSLFSFAEGGESSELFRNIEGSGSAPIPRSPDEEKTIKNMNEKRSDGFKTRLIPLWKKLTGIR